MFVVIQGVGIVRVCGNGYCSTLFAVPSLGVIIQPGIEWKNYEEWQSRMVMLATCYSTTLLQLQQLLIFQACDIKTAFDWLEINAQELFVAFFRYCVSVCVEGLIRTTQNFSRDRTLSKIRTGHFQNTRQSISRCRSLFIVQLTLQRGSI